MDYFSKWINNLSNKKENLSNKMEQAITSPEYAEKREQIYKDKPWLRPTPVKKTINFLTEGFENPLKTISTIKDVVTSKEYLTTISQPAKGLAEFGVSLPQVGASLTQELGDVMQEVLKVKKKLGIKPGLGEEATYKLLQDRGAEIIKENQALVEKLNLSKDAKKGLNKLYFDLGSGAGSIALSIGLAAATGSTAIPAISFGAIAKSAKYQELRKNNVDVISASLLSSGAGATEAALEGVGLEIFLKNYSTPLKTLLIRSLSEGIQEFSQEVGGNIWSKIGYDKGKNILEGAWYAGLIGFMLGVPTSVTLDTVTKDVNTNIQELNDKEKKTVIEKVDKYINKSLESQKTEIKNILEEPQVTQTSSQVKEAKAVSVLKQEETKTEIKKPQERVEIINLIKDKKNEVKDVKSKLYAYITQNIPKASRGKFLTRMKTVNTRTQLSEVFRAVDKEQNRILQKDLIAEIENNVNQIKKLDATEQIKIGQFLDNISLSNISKAEQKKITNLKNFIKENPDVIQKLGRTNIKRVSKFKEIEKDGLKKLSIDELLKFKNTLTFKIQESKKITKAKQAIDKYRNENNINKLSKIILEGKEILPQWASKAKEKSSLLKKIELSQVRPNYLFDLFDHHPKFFGTGENYNTLYKPIVDASSKIRNSIQTEKENFRKLLKKYKIKINDAHKLKIVNGQELSLSERLDIVLRSKDPYQLEIQKKYNGFTDELIKNIENSLSKGELELIDWAIDYYKRRGKVLAKVAMEVDQKILELTEGYNPVNYVYEQNVDEEEQLADIIFRTSFKPSVPEAGMTMARTGKISKLNYDFFGNLNNNIGRFEHYIFMRPLYHNTRNIIFSNKWSNAVTQEFSKLHYEQAKKWWEQTISRKQEHLNMLEKMSEGLRRNFVRSVLSIPRLTTAYKQAISTSTAASQIGGKWVLLGWQQNIQDNSKVQEIFSESQILKDRIGKFNRDIENMSELSTKRLFGNNVKEILDKQMSVIRFIDKQTVYAVAAGSYMKMMEESNNNHIKSLKYAEDIVSSTQPMATLETLSPILSYKGFSRWLTMFNNQLNQNYNIWRRWALRMKKGEATTSETLHIAFYHWVLPSLILRAISIGLFPWDKDEKEKFFNVKGIITDLLSYPVQSIIILGKILTNIVKGYPLEPMAFNEIFQKVDYFIKSKSDEKRLKHGLSFLGLLLGIGIDQTRNTIDDIKKFFNGGQPSMYDNYPKINIPSNIKTPKIPSIKLPKIPKVTL